MELFRGLRRRYLTRGDPPHLVGEPFQPLLRVVELRRRHLLRPAGDLACVAEQVVQHLPQRPRTRSEEHTSELQSRVDLVCRLLLEKKNTYEPLAHTLSRTPSCRHTPIPRPSLPTPFPSTPLFRPPVAPRHTSSASHSNRCCA